MLPIFTVYVFRVDTLILIQLFWICVERFTVRFLANLKTTNCYADKINRYDQSLNNENIVSVLLPFPSVQFGSNSEMLYKSIFHEGRYKIYMLTSLFLQAYFAPNCLVL